jgi:hypothetical protein
VEGWAFFKYHPQFVPALIKNKDYFQDHFKQYELGDRNRNIDKFILVYLSCHLENFIAAQTTVRRIKQVYPLTEMKVCAAPIYKGLIIDSISSVDYVTGMQNTLKEFTLNESFSDHFYTNINESLLPKHELLLRSTNLYNGKLDKGIKPVTANRFKELANGCNMFLFSNYGADPVFADEVRRLKGIPIVELGDSFRLKPELITKVKESEKIICIGDIPLGILAGYLEKKALVFLDKTPQKRELQYKCYDNVTVYAMPDDDNEEQVKAGIKIIKDFIRS